MTTKSRPRLQLRTIILAACAALLTWLVVTRSLAAYLAEAAPQSALWLSPGQPEALVNLADRSLNSTRTKSETESSSDVANQAPSQQNSDDADKTDVSAAVDQSPQRNNSPLKPANAAKGAADFRNMSDAFAVVDQDASVDLAALHAEVVSALLQEPLNARALRILGQLAEIAKDDASALRFIKAAARLSLHESIAVYWLMHRSAIAGDYKTALYYADALIRAEPNFATYAVPVLAHFAEDKASSNAVKSLLASNPSWRYQFFSLLPQSVTDARTPLTLLLALRSDPVPPTVDEIKPYLDFLIAHQFYSLAYYTWLQFLPLDELSHAALLHNGSFEGMPSGLPFDWQITQGTGVTIDVVPRPDQRSGHALMVDFQYGRVDYHSVSELVMLAPGTYQFNGEYKGSLVGPRGMKWRIVCANGTVSGESSMITGLGSNWKNLAFTFTVPATNCPAQYVRLDLDARMASEQLISGSILFDQLQISRVAKPSTVGNP